MLAQNLITDSIPPVRPTDLVERVLVWMGEFKVKHLPVVADGLLVAIISESELLETRSGNMPISSLDLFLGKTSFTYDDSHIYDVLKVMTENKMDMVPVLNASNNRYVGMITGPALLDATSLLLNVGEQGGVIVLQVAHNSYSLSEIGRICESNDAKVLSLTLGQAPDPTQLYVTLKLNLRDLSRTIASFERFEYNIAHVVFDSDQLDDYRERYENLLRYLSI